MRYNTISNGIVFKHPMARVKKFNETITLERAMRLFWTHGYDGTSLQMLEDEMELVRSSIYNAYGNKRALFHKAITHYKNTIIMDLIDSIDREKDIRKAVAKLLNGEVQLHFNQKNPGGCLIVLSVLEKARHGDQSTQLLESIIQKMEEFLFNKILKAQNDGQISDQINAKNTAVTIAATVLGIAVMGKAGFKKEVLQQIAKTATRLLEHP